jgi:hypothetical protein
VLLLSCVACVGLIFWVGSQAANNPTFASTLAVTAFCGNEQQQRYTAAYDEFSTNLQSQMTRDQFVSASQAHDSAGGTVSDCTASPTGVVQQNDTSASFDVTVTRGTGATAATSDGTITLVKEGGSWKIDNIDPSLGLT